MAVTSPSDRWRRRLRLARRVISLAAMVALAAAWIAFLRPATLGGSAGYVIVSGNSMEPMMSTGDLAIVHAKETYGRGDVVAYRIPEGDVGRGMLVIHRVIGGSPGQGLVLKGDNRGHPDMWRPKSGDIVGALRWHVPHAGTALFLLRTPLVVAMAAGLTAFWMVVMLDNPRSGDARDGDPAADEPLTTPKPSVHCPTGPRPRAPHRPEGVPPWLAPAVVGFAIGMLAGDLPARR